MFSPDIVESDAFLEMPISTQALYFHLGMYADDDGFVNPRKIMRMLGASDDDMKVLIAKRFALPFESGVIVIKHWRLNNLVRKDWYRPTQYVDEKALLFMKENGSYTMDPQQGVPLLVNESVTSRQRRLGKDSIGKDREEEGVGSMKYLASIPAEDMREFVTRFDITPGKVRSVAEDLVLYCQRKGKTYKNYKAFLLNAIKRDHRQRPAPKPPEPPEKPVSPEQQAANQKKMQEIRDSLSGKFKIKP